MGGDEKNDELLRALVQRSKYSHCSHYYSSSHLCLRYDWHERSPCRELKRMNQSSINKTYSDFSREQKLTTSMNVINLSDRWIAILAPDGLL